MPRYEERPFDRADTAHACLDAITQLVSSCGNLRDVATNDFSQLLALVSAELRDGLDGIIEEDRQKAGGPSHMGFPGMTPDAMPAGRA